VLDDDTVTEDICHGKPSCSVVRWEGAKASHDKPCKNPNQTRFKTHHLHVKIKYFG